MATPAPPPEFVYADLLAVDAALKNGVNTVKFADREITYNSTSDLILVRNLIKEFLDSQNPKTIRRQLRIFTPQR